MSIIDFHSHILPGIDDGSEDKLMSRLMLQSAKEQGTDIQVLTPHFYADKTSPDEFLAKRQEAYNLIAEDAAQIGIQLKLGAEVAFFHGMSGSDDIYKFIIQDTNAILIEMPFRQWTNGDIKEIENIRNQGVIPIIAHINRYLEYQKDKRPYKDLLTKDVVFQINTEVAGNGKQLRQAVKFIKKHNTILGTDAHNITNRVVNLRPTREKLLTKISQEQLDAMDLLANGIFE